MKLEKWIHREGQQRSCFHIWVGDETDAVKIKLYRNNSKGLTVGRTYRFENVIRKFGGFWFNTMSKMTMWANVNVPEEVITEIRSMFENAKEVPNSPRNIKDALDSNNTSTIQGKVAQVFILWGELY